MARTIADMTMQRIHHFRGEDTPSVAAAQRRDGTGSAHKLQAISTMAGRAILGKN
jgi:hypothetical protein